MAEKSPFGRDRGFDPSADVELQVAVNGLDGTTFRRCTPRHRYLPEEFRFGSGSPTCCRKARRRLELDYARLTTPCPRRFKRAPGPAAVAQRVEDVVYAPVAERERLFFA